MYAVVVSTAPTVFEKVKVSDPALAEALGPTQRILADCLSDEPQDKRPFIGTVLEDPTLVSLLQTVVGDAVDLAQLCKVELLTGNPSWSDICEICLSADGRLRPSPLEEEEWLKFLGQDKPDLAESFWDRWTERIGAKGALAGC